MFAGGCFWGTEWVFEHVRGVTRVVSGFSGGAPANGRAGTGTTGHAESVRVTYDPSKVSYRQLLEVFFRVAHDPTSRDRQGPDVGPEYRAIVFAKDSTQLRDVSAYVNELTAQRVFRKPIVTELTLQQPFHEAEAFHQNYAERHPTEPYIAINDAPKLKRLQELFPQLYVVR